MNTNFEFEPEDVINECKKGLKEKYTNLRSDLMKLATSLDKCQDVFHGSNKSGTQNSIYKIYENFSKLIGSVNGTTTTGCWGVAYQEMNLINSSYEVAKNYQDLQEKVNAFDGAVTQK